MLRRVSATRVTLRRARQGAIADPDVVGAPLQAVVPMFGLGKTLLC